MRDLKYMRFNYKYKYRDNYRYKYELVPYNPVFLFPLSSLGLFTALQMEGAKVQLVIVQFYCHDE